ncbi:MAG: type II toxin-antitoxin system VapC family toxin [SAR324 cluster bacterium]|nr:type II toxin-antitoxin system VapC family toxin [SAR324 cluster bacterium]
MTQSVVIDNSIVMRWFHPSGTQSDLAFADTILEALEAGKIIPIAPIIFTMEFPNVLHNLRRRGELSRPVETALLQWEHLGFEIIGTDHKAILYMQALSQLCSEHGLSVYDAAYLELAIRLNCPLATLDKQLEKATITADAALFSSSAK